MLPDSLPIGTTSFVKLNDDTKTGTIYVDSVSGVNPLSVTIRHTMPVMGKKGISVHNIKIVAPLDSDDIAGVLTGDERATLSLTIQHPTPMLTFAEIHRALHTLSLFLQGNSTTAISSTAVGENAEILLGSQ